MPDSKSSDKMTAGLMDIFRNVNRNAPLILQDGVMAAEANQQHGAWNALVDVLRPYPNTKYGDILPLAQHYGDPAENPIRFALPNAIREPLLSSFRLMDTLFNPQKATEQVPADFMKSIMPDVLSVMTSGRAPKGNYREYGGLLSRMGIKPPRDLEDVVSKWPGHVVENKNKITGHVIIDRQQNKVISDIYTPENVKRARTRVNKLDEQWGAYRYHVAPIFEDAQGNLSGAQAVMDYLKRTGRIDKKD